MDSESSETNLVIITKKDRVLLCCKLYWRLLVIIITPLVLLPIAFINGNNAYKCFYIFLISAVYWVADVLHPAIIAFIPITLSTLVTAIDKSFIISQIYVRNELLDCLCVMMIIVAIEHSQMHKRLALKLLLVFGCSHYRLSFLLFFSSMFLSMWLSSTMACGLMMPLTKAILVELEKMGILEIYQTIGKNKQKSKRHELNNPRPTEFTVFYYLGIAYSTSIGGMATLTGNQNNQIFKIYCETFFPLGPKIEFPHFMLLNLPGVLIIETLLYLWMNSYFLGMFRAQSDIAIEIGLTEEEAQYIQTLLVTQYEQLKTFDFHECVVSIIVILTLIIQAGASTTHIDNLGPMPFHSHVKTSAPSTICVILLFLMPTTLDWLRFLRRPNNLHDPLPTAPSKACLNWKLARDNIHWSVLLIIGGSCTIFEALKDTAMTEELEKFLVLFESWPVSALALVVIIFCKLFTEFATNSCVAYCLLPTIARMSVLCKVNPHYLMMAAALSSSLPFHLVTGTPANAMVAAYMHISPWKMMAAGIGPSMIGILVIWFTVTVWSKAIWTDINSTPDWVDVNILINKV